MHEHKIGDWYIVTVDDYHITPKGAIVQFDSLMTNIYPEVAEEWSDMYVTWHLAPGGSADPLDVNHRHLQKIDPSPLLKELIGVDEWK